MDETNNEATEIDTLENHLLQSEYNYKSDITLLQKALIRTRRLENLHLIGLQIRVAPALTNYQKHYVHYFFFKWKSEIFLNKTYLLKKIWRLLRFLYKKMLTRAFLVFRERENRIFMERILYPGFRGP